MARSINAVQLAYICLVVKAQSKDSDAQLLMMFPDASGLAYVLPGNSLVDDYLDTRKRNKMIEAGTLKPNCRFVITPENSLKAVPAVGTTFNEDKSTQLTGILSKYTTKQLLFSNIISYEQAVAHEVGAMLYEDVLPEVALQSVQSRFKATKIIANTVASRMLAESNAAIQAEKDGTLETRLESHLEALQEADSDDTELIKDDAYSNHGQDLMVDTQAFLDALSDNVTFTKSDLMTIATQFNARYGFNIAVNKTMTNDKIRDAILDEIEIKSPSVLEAEYETMH